MTFLKVVLVPISFVILVVGGWCVYNLRDVDLNPDFDGFFVSNEFNTLNNFHVAWAGIHAPERTRDLYAYGVGRVAQGSDYVSGDLRFQGGGVSMDGFCFNQADYRDGKDCTLSQGFQKVRLVNGPLLARYRDLYNRRDLQVNVGDRFSIEGTYVQDLILLHRLNVLELIEMAKNGQASDAIDEIVSSMENIQDVVNGKITVVEHAVWMVMFGQSLDALPVILLADVSVIEQKKSRVEDILGWDYSLVWNVSAMQRAEYNILSSVLRDVGMVRRLFFKINDTKNKFYKISQAKLAMSQMSAQEMTGDVIEEFVSEYDLCHLGNDFDCLGYNAIGNLWLDSFVAGGKLFQTAHVITAKQRAVVVWMQAKEQEVEPNEMTDFLSKTDPALYNPYTQEPFFWDGEKGSIYFNVGGVEAADSRRDVYL